ncbi:7423_t:CDS:2 [Funneliformis geosporum]|uniref:7423_t:CDS:1 n=1 Tax=Funneliformis geosporum TaxID=1117311 RepID=A0A9W4SF13_9GLOM|nr:7423_t:CDS:2 [Funneliformis geosporum]
MLYDAIRFRCKGQLSYWWKCGNKDMIASWLYFRMIKDVRIRLQSSGVLGEDKLVSDVIGYGHIGDGNLHLNIVAKTYDPKVTNLIESYVYEWTEHGLGLKAEYLGYTKSPPMISLMNCEPYQHDK